MSEKCIKVLAGGIQSVLLRVASLTDRGQLLRRLFCDDSGSQIILVTLLMPAFLGLAALATDGANLAYIHLNLQAAADTAALSAEKLAINNLSPNTSLEAEFVAAQYGVVNGTNGATVVAFAPKITPSGTKYSGCTLSATAVSAINTKYPQAIEVIVSQPPVQTISLYFGLVTNNICALAVAAPNPTNGGSCMLALGTTGVDINISGNNTTINTSSCGLSVNSKSNNSITIGGNNDAFTGPVSTAGGISGSTSDFSPPPLEGVQPAVDPYATPSSSWPSTCSGGACGSQSCSPCGASLSPGVYPNGISLNSNNATYTMSPGVYYLGPAGLSVGGQQVTLNATGGVTLVFQGTSTTGSGGINVATNGFTLNLVAPSNASQWNDGIAVWQPLPTQFTPNAKAPTDGISFSKNNPDLNVTGLIYMPDGSVSYGMNNGQTTCTQVVAQSFNFSKNNTTIGFENGAACNGVAGAPTKQINQSAALVE